MKCEFTANVFWSPILYVHFFILVEEVHTGAIKCSYLCAITLFPYNEFVLPRFTHIFSFFLPEVFNLSL